MNNWKEHVIMMYCSDCGGYRNQKFLKEMSEGTALYICETCGCENTLEDEKTKQ